MFTERGQEGTCCVSKKSSTHQPPAKEVNPLSMLSGSLIVSERVGGATYLWCALPRPVAQESRPLLK
jgi:hypothetical protein